MKTTWDLEILKNGKEFKELHKTCLEETNKFIKKWNNNDTWLENESKLFEALEEYNSWETSYGIFEDEWLYYYLMQSLDQKNSEIQASYNKIYSEAMKLQNEIQFFFIKLSKISKSQQKKFLESNKLEKYRHVLERVFRSGKHTLSEPEEKIMNLKSKVSYGNWVKMLSSMLSDEEREVLDQNENLVNKNFSEILELMSNKNKKIRDKAAEAFNNILEQHLDVAENEFNSVLENKQINDSIRSYKYPDESRFIADDIDKETVDTLLEVVTANFQIAKDFYKLKAEVLGLEKLEYHERNIEVSEIDKKYKFEEAYNVVDRTFSELDSDFHEVFDRMFKNNQVDVFPKKGKRSGAFAMTNRIDQPSFILLNYTESLNDILTMAHEFGHAINFELSKKQEALNFDFPMCTAETSSTFCEDFVLDTLLADTDDKLRFSIQMMKLNSDISTIFRQIAFYNFERELHREFRDKGYLSHKDIGKLFRKHMESYMGEYVEQSEGSQNWWIYVSHFRSFFYVYSYAFGLLISKAFQKNVKKDKKFMSKVKEFFAGGNKLSPKDQLSLLGIDITKNNIWEEGINEVRLLLEDTKQLYKKISV